uniref:Phospholipase n=1 Tax=Oryzias sinensis TaxID=183150 RepID=A0A8C7ZY55_9TELE
IKEAGKPYLIPGVPITCRVDNTERHTTRSKVRVSTLYTVEVKHGPFLWTVKRKYKHFQELHLDIYKHKMLHQWNPLGRLVHYSVHLTHANHFPQIWAMEFLSISALSFVADLGPKGLEGPIYKRSGGHRIQGLNCFGHHQFCLRWSQRWLVVKDSFLMYMSRDNCRINFVLLFDPEFCVKVGHAHTDIRDGVCFENFTRSLVIKCNNFRQSLWWSHQINQIKEECDFCKVQDYGGFFPPRENTLTKWYVNGRDYFADLADALEQAKEEIFITDWCPYQFFLKRPATDNYWRLDELLKRKAEQGVKVCILLYKEVEVALGISSDYSKRTLMDLNTNIKVMRHPDHLSSVVLLWAHHEKTVAIDQTVAFVGGIDLAFGRWDDSQYRLTDLCSASGENEEQPGAEVQVSDTGAAQDPLLENSTNQEPLDLSRNTKLWLGKDYNNFVKKDWVQLDKPFEDNVDRSEVPRMPWRDLSAAIHGKAARDVARHFIQRWNFTKIFKSKYKDDYYPYLLPKSSSVEDPFSYVVPGSKKAKVQVWKACAEKAGSSCKKKKTSSSGLQLILSRHLPFLLQNQFFISCTGENGSNGIGDAIVNRILRAHREQKKYRVFVVIPLLPGFEGDLTANTGNAIQAILHFTFRTICRGEKSILQRLLKDQWTEYITFCGLRTHSQLSQKLVTELIYVHSKTLIADDRCYIIGSANINDRSMLGTRDSEVAVLVEDEEKVPSIMGGEPYQAGRLTLALRKECFSVLVGATSDPSINIDDPISDDFFHVVWNETAKLNASIYDKVFRCLPCDSVRNKRELKEHSSQERLCDTNYEQAAEELKAIRGLLVHFPLNFLCEENLLPPLNTKEGMAPVEMWT